ncbi:hypothetical protein N0V82_004967 [Gnomoniopsis sp. IMI 355080]|nr:hypothetical protein N0V82_004967 [Gnomoniopsis sp. IMI 355080]
MSLNQTHYARVETGEHGDIQYDSSTDVDESPTARRLEEKLWDEYRHAPRPRTSCWRQCFSSVLLQGLLNTGLLLLVLALLLDRRSLQQKYGQFEGSGDITGFIPTASQQIKSFVPDMGFAPENGSEFFSEAVQAKWLSIVPKGLGYLKVDNPSEYNNLPHPVKGYNDTVFTTSVTHQLHCLYNILEVYSSLTSGQSIEEQMKGHLPHCFEYLRQSIMCCGDTALEGQHTTFPNGIIGSDGWDAKHVCKDYGQIFEYLDQNRVDDQVWI